MPSPLGAVPPPPGWAPRWALAMTLGKEEEVEAECCPSAALEGPSLWGWFGGPALWAEGRPPLLLSCPGAPPFTAPTTRGGMKPLAGGTDGRSGP